MPKEYGAILTKQFTYYNLANKLNWDKEMELMKIDASTVILGFTGSIGSGCTYISKLIPNIRAPKKYKYYRLSDVIREALKSDGIDEPSVNQLQDKGNELRRNNKRNHLIVLLLEKIDSEWIPGEDFGIVIDGIKNEGEVTALRQFPFFYLFSVQALKEIRGKRVIEDGRFKNWEEFNTADLRDQLEEYKYGQQVPKCSYLSDIIILNDTDIPSVATVERERFVRGIHEKYIKLIESLQNQDKLQGIAPTIDELCMTMAYVLSKSSSCLKRQVGAVVAGISKIENGGESFTGKALEMPFIVSSGYNEVPLGSYQCIYHPDYEKCYRDYLQEAFAQNLVHCPKCGRKIDFEVKCPFCGQSYKEFLKTCKSCHKEIDFIFNCLGCSSNIFDLYIPGSKKAPGKLLDMCRALHAEEVALLQLAQYSGKTRENLVLYVTTQPCNLCSNKIVLAGIKKVVYAEPYSMKEAEEVLKNGNVETKRFEGVKSSAYFKLYQ